MNKGIRRAAIGLAIVLGVAGATTTLGLALAELRLHRRVDVAVRSIDVPRDAAALERGGYLYATRGCGGCHGANGAGRVFIDDPGGLRVRAPNITRAQGSAASRYRSEDWVRAVRHGVKPDGRPLFIMPSEDYNQLTDADLGALIAHLQRLAPSAGGGMEAELPLALRLAYGFGVLKDAAAKIDHRREPPAPVPEGVTAAHGAYVANTCIGCHGPGLGGGRIPGAPPQWPAAANLTRGPGSVLPHYPDAEAFIAMMRTGTRADGSRIGVMPFEAFRAMSDVDLRALYVFLHAAPVRSLGQR